MPLSSASATTLPTQGCPLMRCFSGTLITTMSPTRTLNLARTPSSRWTFFTFFEDLFFLILTFFSESEIFSSRLGFSSSSTFFLTPIDSFFNLNARSSCLLRRFCARASVPASFSGGIVAGSHVERRVGSNFLTVCPCIDSRSSETSALLRRTTVAFRTIGGNLNAAIFPPFGASAGGRWDPAE